MLTMLTRVAKIQGRKSRDKEAYGSDWSILSRNVRESSNWTCSKCRQNFSSARHTLHSHHIIPLSKGGSNTFSNLTSLCISCHKEEHGHH